MDDFYFLGRPQHTGYLLVDLIYFPEGSFADGGPDDGVILFEGTVFDFDYLLNVESEPRVVSKRGVQAVVLAGV